MQRESRQAEQAMGKGRGRGHDSAILHGCCADIAQADALNRKGKIAGNPFQARVSSVPRFSGSVFELLNPSKAF
jgi:hypothetical protein